MVPPPAEKTITRMYLMWHGEKTLRDFHFWFQLIIENNSSMPFTLWIRGYMFVSDTCAHTQITEYIQQYDKYAVDHEITKIKGELSIYTQLQLLLFRFKWFKPSSHLSSIDSDLLFIYIDGWWVREWDMKPSLNGWQHYGQWRTMDNIEKARQQLGSDSTLETLILLFFPISTQRQAVG